MTHRYLIPIISLSLSQPVPSNRPPSKLRNTVVNALLQLQSVYNQTEEITDYQIDLIQFFNEQYPSLLDDYIKLSSNQHKLTNIRHILSQKIQCNPGQCTFVEKYFQDLASSPGHDEYDFYQNLINTMHCYLIHPTLVQSNPNCLSHHGYHTHSHSQKYMKKLKEKFKLKEADKPMMDRMYEYIMCDNIITKSIMAEMQQFIIEHGYDTEAIEYDITCETESNIHEMNGQIYCCLKKYFHLSKCM